MLTRSVEESKPGPLKRLFAHPLWVAAGTVIALIALILSQCEGSEPPEIPPPTEVPDDEVEEPNAEETQGTDYEALVHSGDTFYVAFEGSESCLNIGELGDIQLGEIYEMKFLVKDGTGYFRTEGPSQANPDCTRKAETETEAVIKQNRVTNLGDDWELRLNIWGRNGFSFDPDTGVVIDSRTGLQGQICEVRAGCTA